MEFLVRFRWAVPSGMTVGEWDDLLKQEREVGAGLRASGIMKRSWTVPGRREALSLFEAEDATALHAALSSLPIFPLADISVEPLAWHEMDSSE